MPRTATPPRPPVAAPVARPGGVKPASSTSVGPTPGPFPNPHPHLTFPLPHFGTTPTSSTPTSTSPTSSTPTSTTPTSSTSTSTTSTTTTTTTTTSTPPPIPPPPKEEPTTIPKETSPPPRRTTPPPTTDLPIITAPTTNFPQPSDPRSSSQPNAASATLGGPSPTLQPENESVLPPGAVIGIVAGSLIVVVLIATLLLRYTRHRNNQDEMDDIPSSLPVAGPASSSLRPFMSHSSKYHHHHHHHSNPNQHPYDQDGTEYQMDCHGDDYVDFYQHNDPSPSYGYGNGDNWQHQDLLNQGQAYHSGGDGYQGFSDQGHGFGDQAQAHHGSGDGYQDFSNQGHGFGDQAQAHHGSSDGYQGLSDNGQGFSSQGQAYYGGDGYQGLSDHGQGFSNQGQAHHGGDGYQGFSDTGYLGGDGQFQGLSDQGTTQGGGGQTQIQPQGHGFDQGGANQLGTQDPGSQGFSNQGSSGTFQTTSQPASAPGDSGDLGGGLQNGLPGGNQTSFPDNPSQNIGQRDPSGQPGAPQQRTYVPPPVGTAPALIPQTRVGSMTRPESSSQYSMLIPSSPTNTTHETGEDLGYSPRSSQALVDPTRYHDPNSRVQSPNITAMPFTQLHEARGPQVRYSEEAVDIPSPSNSSPPNIGERGHPQLQEYASAGGGMFFDSSTDVRGPQDL